jgi:predicted nucleic acid-binding protein
VIVLDASAALAVILRDPSRRWARESLTGAVEVHVPEHFHAETISGIGRLAQRGDLDELTARRSLRAVAALRALRHPVLPLYAGIWARRDNLSAYDAAYLALAERLGAGLLTVDRGLAAAARSEGRLVAAGV